LASPFISAREQGIVVFRIWKSLTYPKRIILGFVLILAGMIMQYLMTALLPGLLLILCGNLLLIVRGYDNRVNTGKFEPTAAWEKVNKSKFQEVERLHRDMKKWDRSALDITNGLGFFILAVISAAIGLIYLQGESTADRTLTILAWDAALLLLPHWVTGVRSILTKPRLILKINGFKTLLDEKSHPWLAGYEVDYFMMLAGEKAKIPDDVKVRINMKNQHKDFLGLYGQIVTNEVNGATYPYFYVVLVARRGFGLQNAFQSFVPPAKITKEFKIENDVEVLVIRQTTTTTSGYHTKDKDMETILKTGIDLAAGVAVAPR
jgi:hypothetical protein